MKTRYERTAAILNKKYDAVLLTADDVKRAVHASSYGASSFLIAGIGVFEIANTFFELESEDHKDD